MPTDWFDGTVQLTAQVALSAADGAYGAWGEAMWGVDTWGPDVIWVDVSNRLRPPLRTERAFGREVQAWESGSATLSLGNDDAALSPTNLAGPYVTAGVSEVRPGRDVRILATHNGVTYPLYRGYADDWQETWVPGSGVATVTVPCSDELSALAAVDPLEQPTAGAGELSGARVHRILDNAGHTGERRVDAGETTLQGTTLASNVVTELKLVADSEGGALYVDADGTVVFDGRSALFENPRSTSVQATFGDGSGGVTEVPCTQMATSFNRDLIVNIATFARAGGTVQTATDPTSRNLYRDRPYKRDDLLCETDGDALVIAQWHIARFKDPEYRFESVTVKPTTAPDRLFPVVLGLQVRDLVKVVRRAPGGLTITQYCHVAGIAHQVVGGDWETTFTLSSATPYLALFNSLWDTGTWGGVLWSF